MIKFIESSCSDSIFEKVIAICDNCNKEAVASSMDEFEDMAEKFVWEENYCFCNECFDKKEKR